MSSTTEQPWRISADEAEYSTGRCVEMPCCGLLIGAEHHDADGSYSCPQCTPNDSPAIDLIATERHRQKTKEGYDPAHDDQHVDGEIGEAAAAYLHGDGSWWPWDTNGFKPWGGRTRNLVVAGALIAAEIDRIQRLEAGGPR